MDSQTEDVAENVQAGQLESKDTPNSNQTTDEQSSNPISTTPRQSSPIVSETPAAESTPVTNDVANGVENGTDVQLDTSDDLNAALDDFDWTDIENRYHQKMRECEESEQEIYAEFENWMNVFKAWAATTRDHENNRSFKRLKTRISFVQTSEERLEDKRKHYAKVVQAFESALALLGST